MSFQNDSAPHEIPKWRTEVDEHYEGPDDSGGHGQPRQ
jgi:hypothetical protein